MSLRDWLRSLFSRPAPPAETAQYYDVDNQRVVRIPVAELAPGVIQARVQGIDGVVWIDPKQLKHDEIKHPPFDEGTREHIRRIQATFTEHRDLSFDEWEGGFRRDDDPAQEIALWSHAADVYSAFVETGAPAEHKTDVYRCILACLTTSPEGVWHVFRPAHLSRAEAEQIVQKFFGKQREEGDE